MDPLIKWPGGKAREWPALKTMCAPYARLVEPFAGGAAVFCAEEPQSAFLSDVNPLLTGLYKAVGSGDPRFADSARALGRTWDAVRSSAAGCARALHDDAELGAADVVAAISAAAASPGVWLDTTALARFVDASLADKRARIAAWVGAPEADQVLGVGTAVVAGFYTWLRDAWPDPPCGGVSADTFARFWALRELAYGSMFRVNKHGHFNIPYGGASYNSRDLSAKIERMLASGHDLFSRAQIVTADFRDAWEVAGIGPDDLVFCDPPYDSPFSSYDGFEFGHDAHQALADLVVGSDARVMVVVGRTQFVDDIWAAAAERRPGLARFVYKVRYTYSVKGRNEQAMEHLVVTTFEPASVPDHFSPVGARGGAAGRP